MPRLDQRLTAAAKLIRGRVHADIGSDHGHLPAALLAGGRVRRVIAVERNAVPAANSRRTLAGMNAEVRRGDGLSVIEPGEIDGLSICGMGGRTIAKILVEGQSVLPGVMVLQPNRHAATVRRTAIGLGYWIDQEELIPTRSPGRFFEIIRFRKDNAAPIPIPSEFELYYGPRLLSLRDPVTIDRMKFDRDYLSARARLSGFDRDRLRSIKDYLASQDQQPT